MRRPLLIVSLTLVAAFFVPTAARAATTETYAVAASMANADLKLFATEVAAQAHCPNDVVVWLNTDTGIYHEKGMRWYGRTKHGAYVCRKEAWFRAQQNARSYNMPKRKLDWPLGGGVLKCECGTPLVGLTGGQHGGTGKKRAYYHCRDARRAHGTVVKAKAVVHQKEVIEDQFVELLQHLAASPDVTALYAKRAGTPDDDERELRKRVLQPRTEIGSLETRRDRLFAALEEGAMDTADWRGH